MEKGKKCDVAVVGTGMAGLVTAYLLHHDKHKRFRVRLLDKVDDVSLSAESIAVPIKSTQGKGNSPKASWIDVPMRAFAGGYYQNLVRMYDYLGIRYQSQPFLFSFARLARGSTPAAEHGQSQHPYMIHASNFYQIPPMPRGDLIQWFIEVVYVLVCYLYFTLCCFFVEPCQLKSGEVESFEQYVRRVHLPNYYVSNYILPMISTVCTCSHSELLQFPASDLIAYKRRTHRQPHLVVSDGVRAVQEKLLGGLDVRLGIHSTRVKTTPDGVQLTTMKAGDKGETTERFDLVILAVPPDAAAAIFEPVRPTLDQVPTTTVRTIAHTDYSNISYNKNGIKPPKAKGQHIYLRTNNFVTEAVHAQPNSIIITTNPLSPINPEKIIRAASFTRVLRSPRSQLLLNELFREGKYRSRSSPAWRNGDGGVYLTGGWCWDGMVLLEGCVVSAMRIATSLGVDIPW